jgi:hypothetical protein
MALQADFTMLSSLAATIMSQEARKYRSSVYALELRLESIAHKVSVSIINPEDGIPTVLAKSKRLADRVLDGKSIGVALGDIKVKRQEEQEHKNLSLKEKHKWQLWKNEKGEMPPMQWQAEHEEEQGDNHDATQQGLGKRKGSSIQEGGQTDLHRRVKKRNGDESSRVTMMEIEALAEIYHLPPEARCRVVEADVRHFRRTYAPLKPLLTAVTKIMQARSEASHLSMDKKMEEEMRSIEMHSTEKAIYLAEKQAKWILDETTKMCDGVHEQVSILRGRLSALQDQQDDDDEEDYDSAASSTAASPVSGRGDELQEQIEQDDTMEGDAMEASPASDKHESTPVSSPQPKPAEVHQMTSGQDSRLAEQMSATIDQRDQLEQLQQTSFQEETVPEHSIVEHDELAEESYYDHSPVEGVVVGQDVPMVQEPQGEEVADTSRNMTEQHQEEGDIREAEVWEPYNDAEQLSHPNGNESAEDQGMDEPHQGEEQEVDSVLAQEQHPPSIIAPTRKPITAVPQEKEEGPVPFTRVSLGGWSKPWYDAQGRSKSVTPLPTKTMVDAAIKPITVSAVASSAASQMPPPSSLPPYNTINKGNEAFFTSYVTTPFFQSHS